MTFTHQQFEAAFSVHDPQSQGSAFLTKELLLLSEEPFELLKLKIETGLAFLDQHAGLPESDRNALSISIAFWMWFLRLWLVAENRIRADHESMLALRLPHDSESRKRLHQLAVLDLLKKSKESVWSNPGLITGARQEQAV